jgi:hypothetical protein
MKKKYYAGFEEAAMYEIATRAQRLGITPDEFVKRSIEETARLTDEVGRGRKVYLRDKSGEEYPYHIRGTEENDDDGRPACVPGDTKILTPSGAERPIDSLKAGDIVMSFDCAKGLLVPARILKLKRCGRRPIIKLILDDSRELRGTASHSLLTPARRWRRWRPIGRIGVGDEVISVTGPRRVASISPDRIEPVYNLVTSGQYNFVAGGVITHNFTWIRGPRMAFYNMVEAFHARRPPFKRVPSSRPAADVV